MARKYVNGLYLDMTEEELAVVEAGNKEHEASVEERIAELEAALFELTASLKK